jgi:hypothetical protein
MQPDWVARAMGSPAAGAAAVSAAGGASVVACSVAAGSPTAAWAAGADSAAGAGSAAGAALPSTFTLPIGAILSSTSARSSAISWLDIPASAMRTDRDTALIFTGFFLRSYA